MFLSKRIQNVRYANRFKTPAAAGKTIPTVENERNFQTVSQSDRWMNGRGDNGFERRARNPVSTPITRVPCRRPSVFRTSVYVFAVPNSKSDREPFEFNTVPAPYRFVSYRARPAGHLIKRAAGKLDNPVGGIPRARTHSGIPPIYQNSVRSALRTE